MYHGMCMEWRNTAQPVLEQPADLYMMQVPHDVPGNIIRVNCKWSNTANTIQAISMDEDDTSDDVLDSIDADDSMQVGVLCFDRVCCSLVEKLL